MNTFLLIFGAILVVFGTAGVITSDKAFSVIVIGGGILIAIGLFVTPLPTKRDVLDGKAVYQETIHITNSDTIKTYEIVWKQENF